MRTEGSVEGATRMRSQDGDGDGDGDGELSTYRDTQGYRRPLVILVLLTYI